MNETIRQAAGSVTAVAPPGNAEANAFLRRLPRKAPAVYGVVGDASAEPPAAKSAATANAGSGLTQPGPAAQTPAQVMNAILRGAR